MLDQQNVLVCVTGGIAAYKACDLVSKLTQQGANVKVIMSESAMKFVSPLTFQALSRNDVFTDTFDEKDSRVIAHIDLADWANLVIIAPATANTISKITLGIGDDMVTTTLLATEAPIYIAPAMNVHMYQHPAVKKNMQQLADWGYHFIEPGEGYLACGYVGKGRLEEPATIIQVINNHQKSNKLLFGKKLLISAGPTREVIDPVRFFSNRSTGTMGFKLAERAAQYGAEVILVTGPVSIDANHPNIQRIDVTSAEEMYEQMIKHFPQANIVIKAAAVADYRPKQHFPEKVKKQPGDLVIEMERTKDILQHLGQRKTEQFIVGFAAETSDPIHYAKGKIKKKNLDAIVVNDINEEGAGFGLQTNKGTYITKNGDQYELPLAQKDEVAKQILQLIIQQLKDEAK